MSITEQLENKALADCEAGKPLSEYRTEQAIRAIERRTILGDVGSTKRGVSAPCVCRIRKVTRR